MADPLTELFMLTASDTEGIKFACKTYLGISEEEFERGRQWWNRDDRLERMDDTDAWIQEIKDLPSGERTVVVMLMLLSESLDDRCLTTLLRSKEEICNGMTVH